LTKDFAAKETFPSADAFVKARERSGREIKRPIELIFADPQTGVGIPMLKIATVRTGCVAVFSAMLAMSISARQSFADAPATQPAGEDTPQKFLLGLTNDKVSTMTLDQVVENIAYDPASDSEKADAKANAANYIIVSKIELAARDKWGKDAETTVAHALGDNTPEDIANGDWAVDGNQAVVQFKPDGLSPLALIKKGGQWKVDLAGENKLMNQTADDDIKAEQAAGKMLDQLSKDIADKATYPTADVFVQHVKDAESKLGQ
jgi:hypothetical protein